VFAYDLTGPGAFHNRLVSVTAAGSAAGNSASGDSGGKFAPSVSADGRYVAFVSNASDLTGQATNNAAQVYVRDLTMNTTRLVSLNRSGGAGGDQSSTQPRISADGTRVLFQSAADDLTAIPASQINIFQPQLYVRDLSAGTTRLVSVTPGGGVGNGTSGAQNGLASDAAVLSPSGRYVAFNSQATDLVPGFVSGGAGAAWD